MFEIEPFDFEESVERIRKQEMFPILELIPLLEREISRRVYGTVMVMIGSAKTIVVRIRNEHFSFGYEFLQECLRDGSLYFVVDDCIYHYQQEILKRYIKKGEMRNE